jgi:hypothetical protein
MIHDAAVICPEVVRSIIHRRKQLHEIGFMELETMASSKNKQLYETVVVMLLNVTLCMAFSLNNGTFL